MSVLLSAYTRALKRYDPDLYAGYSMDGVPCIFKKWKRFEPVCELEGVPLFNLMQTKQYVCGITHNWSASGRIIDWGIDDVVGHIKEIDYLANVRLFEEMDALNEAKEKQAKGKFKSGIEDFWRDERKTFAKTTGDILTHSLDKSEKRRRLKDKSIHNN